MKKTEPVQYMFNDVFKSIYSLDIDKGNERSKSRNKKCLSEDVVSQEIDISDN